VKPLSNELPPTRERELPPPNRIRVETALSRFPIHSLAKKGTVAIGLQRLNEFGVADFKWEVTYNSKYGQGGPLAYKVDTLVVNRLLDQLGRPLPELVRIGSLSAVCRSLGTQDTGPNIANLKSAFLQNASAFINAKIRYKTKSGREKWAEMGYTRYSVVFTGEALPDGTHADAVYIVLNPPYRELLNHVETRPLDYDYLKKLAPGPQRFYELLSFQIYGAIASARPRAKMLYSDYCNCAPQIRYRDFNHLKKQMYKLHVQHRESGYITKVDYEETTDTEGISDWEMFYTPGPKAFAEYKAFTYRRTQQTMLTAPVISDTHQTPPVPEQAVLGFSEAGSELLADMVSRGIAERKARDLMAHLKPGQEVRDQLEYVDSLISKDHRGKIENPPGLYVFYIRDNVTPPADFWSSRKAKLHEQAKHENNSEVARRAQLEIQYEEYCSAEIKRFADTMPRDEYQQIFDHHRRSNRDMFKSMSSGQLDDLTHGTVRAALAKSGRVQVVSFNQFTQDQRLFGRDPIEVSSTV